MPFSWPTYEVQSFLEVFSQERLNKCCFRDLPVRGEKFLKDFSERGFDFPSPVAYL